MWPNTLPATQHEPADELVAAVCGCSAPEGQAVGRNGRQQCTWHGWRNLQTHKRNKRMQPSTRRTECTALSAHNSLLLQLSAVMTSQTGHLCMTFTCHSILVDRKRNIDRRRGGPKQIWKQGRWGSDHGPPGRHGVGCAARGGGNDKTIRLHRADSIGRTPNFLAPRQALRPLLPAACGPRQDGLHLCCDAQHACHAHREANQPRPGCRGGAWLYWREAGALAARRVHVYVRACVQALEDLRACLHGGDVVAVHEELCADHAGGGPSVNEALVEHMMCCLDGALWPAKAVYPLVDIAVIDTVRSLSLPANLGGSQELSHRPL